VLAPSFQSRYEGSSGLRDDIASRQARVSQLKGSNYQGQTTIPPPISFTGTSAPHVDSVFLKHIIKVVVVGMFSATASGAPTTPTPTDSMVTLVWIVKNMREMGCKPYLGEHNAKTVGI
jgi:hypothetical protein